MIRLEKSLQGHPQVAKQMMEHLPVKTLNKLETNAITRLTKPWSTYTLRPMGPQKFRNRLRAYVLVPIGSLTYGRLQRECIYLKPRTSSSLIMARFPVNRAARTR